MQGYHYILSSTYKDLSSLEVIYNEFQISELYYKGKL